MGNVRHPKICSRLGAAVAFLAYLLAGASFALPAEMRCLRCARVATGHLTIKPGASCPLTYAKRHCHHGHGNTSAKITLCPDGCLRHNGQKGGEIPSLAKFLSTPATTCMRWTPTGFACEHAQEPPLDPLLPPPARPPSLSV